MTTIPALSRWGFPVPSVVSLRTALGSYDRVGRRWAVAYALIHLAERLALLGTALWLLRGGGIRTALLATALGTIVVVRAAVLTPLTRHLHGNLHARAVDKLLEGDLLTASAMRDDDAEAAVLEGVGSGVRLLGGIVPEIVADAAATVVIAGVLVALEAPRLLWVGTIAVSFAGAGVLVANRIAHREEDRAWAAYRPVIDGLVATIGARLEIVANGAADSFRADRQREVTRWEKATFRSAMLVSLARRLPLAVAVFVVGGAILVEQSLHEELTATMFAHAALFGASLPAIAGLGRNVLEVTRHSVRFASLATLLDVQPLLKGKGTYPATLPATMVWESVFVRYGREGESALAGIDLQWESGKVLVLRGPNGSGKSTLLRTLLAVAPLEGGVLRCGGMDLSETDLSKWRGSVAYLAQRPFLPLRGTVKDAFAIVAPDAAPRDIERSLERVGLLPVLARRDADAPLAVDVGSLSVGERQRLALARVLANPRALILLDEPDANLDHAGVKLLAAIVRELVADGRMVAIAAHTDEIVALGDLVVTLEGGRIV